MSRREPEEEAGSEVAREEATGEQRTKSKGTGPATVLGNEAVVGGSHGERGSTRGTPEQEAEAEVGLEGEVGEEAREQRARQVAE